MTTLEQAPPIGRSLPPSRAQRPLDVARPAPALRRAKDHLVAYGLLFPAMAVFTVFFFIPAAYLVYISFFHWGVLSSATQFVGLENFRRLFAQPLFWRSLATSGYYTLVMIPATVLLALGIALGGVGRVGWPASVGGALPARSLEAGSRHRGRRAGCPGGSGLASLARARDGTWGSRARRPDPHEQADVAGESEAVEERRREDQV